MLDTMKNFIDIQFEKLYNFDYKLTLKSEYTEDMLDKITVEYGNNTSKTLGIEVKNGDTREANNIFVDDIS